MSRARRWRRASWSLPEMWCARCSVVSNCCCSVSGTWRLRWLNYGADVIKRVRDQDARIFPLTVGVTAARSCRHGGRSRRWRAGCVAAANSVAVLDQLAASVPAIRVHGDGFAAMFRERTCAVTVWVTTESVRRGRTTYRRLAGAAVQLWNPCHAGRQRFPRWHNAGAPSYPGRSPSSHAVGC